MSGYNLQWPEHETFNDIHCFVHTVKVAKRGIKLNTDYATILTDDSDKSPLIQAVEKQHLDKTILILENLS